MIRKLLACAAAVVTFTLAPVGSALAQSSGQLIAQFDQVCVQPGLERDAQRAAMASAGWMPLPVAFIRQYMGNMPLANIEGYIASSEEAVIIGMLADVPSEGVIVPSCVVGMMPNAGGLRAALTAWAGIQPLEASAQDSMFTFRVTGSTLTPIEASEAELQRLMQSRRLAMIAGRETSTMVMVMVMRF